MDLIVTDGHDGLLATVSELFSSTPLHNIPHGNADSASKQEQEP
jgi:hypothetical protein